MFSVLLFLALFAGFSQAAVIDDPSLDCGKIVVGESKIFLVPVRPEIEVRAIVALDEENPISDSFANWLRTGSGVRYRLHGPEGVEERAMAFAHSVQGKSATFKSRGATAVKFSETTNEFLITVRGRILYYDDLGERRFDFSRPKDVFLNLYRGQVRGLAGMETVAPFEFRSLSRHFRDHGDEFGFEDEEAYAEAAKSFAERACLNCLTIDFLENGTPRKFKADFVTREVVITGRNNALLTYYKNESSQNPYRKFFTNLLKVSTY